MSRISTTLTAALMRWLGAMPMSSRHRLGSVLGWVIYVVLKTADAVTPMPGLIVPFLTFTLLYCLLGVIVVWLLYRQIILSPRVAERRGLNMPRSGKRETRNGVT